jgi:hypothetical protein
MRRRLVLLTLCGALLASAAHPQINFSTGAVNNYVGNGCGGPDLSQCIAEADHFAFWYGLAGLAAVTRWTDGNVWGSDFRDGPGNDSNPSGGSDLPRVYYYSGHGICQNPPASTDPDFIAVCGNFGKPDTTDIGRQSRWGNGNLQFLFLDASCPMDLISIENNWFPVFQGLHVAVGNSGTATSDTLDSESRGSQFAALTVPTPFSWLFPTMSVGDAWMATGIIDVQSGCCAVAIAAGNDRDDAINRRENEQVLSGWGNPTPNWFAWKWICN